MYGNVTVLGAVVSVSEEQTAGGRAVVVVLATAVATFVAHVVADLVAARIGPDEPDPRELREEVRDTVPVASSAVVPAALLGLGALGVVAPWVAQLLAAGALLARLAATGPVVERLSGRRASPAAVWGGVGLAVLGAVIAGVEVLLTH